jgi:zinc protease
MSNTLSYPGPENITRTVLANGITILVRANRATPVVVLEGMLDVGAVDDPATQAGLSSFTTAMLSRGSARYDYKRFNQTIESVGASLYFSSESDAANVGITCLSEDFATLVDVMADALRTPTVPQPLFDVVRGQKLVRLQERAQDTGAMASLRFYETVFGGHALGKPVSGYVESVSTITRDDVAAFHARHYGPQGAIFAVSGDVDPQAAVDLLANALGDWHAPRLPRILPAVAPITQFTRRHVLMAGKVQSDILLGVQAVARNHPDFYAVRLANTILGVFGMMGRLGEVVREQQGLAYYAYSSLDVGRDAGIWLAGAGVNPADLERAVESMLAELDRLAREPVSAEELADSQAYLTGVLPLTLETNDGLASTLLSMEYNGLGLDFLVRYPAIIHAISVDDIQRVARAYLRPDALTVVTAGKK